MKRTNTRDQRTALRAAAFAALAIGLFAVPAAAEGFRNIASVTVDTYFDGSWLVKSEDVFLAQILPGFSLQAKLRRDDAPARYAHRVFLGPIVSFTDSLYMDAVYGLGLDSAGALSHEAEVNLTYETDSSVGGFGVRADFFPSTGYFYLLPSISGKIHPIAPLGLYGKLFVSWDSAALLTASFWGEADWTFDAVTTVRAGFTLSYADGLGYSIIAGTNIRFTPNIMLKYTIQYLSNTIEYLDAPQAKAGIENALMLDVKF